MSEIRETLRRIREAKPLIHCVSNLVTANDCANLLLAIDASPMMAQAPEEMADIAAISSACVLNTGTPDAGRFELCALRGRLANDLRQPCVLDPVGAGASSWRLSHIQGMLERFTPTLVRVNLSEAQALLRPKADDPSGPENALPGGAERGVDSSASGGEAERSACARALSRKLGCAVLLSGSVDHLSDGERCLRIEGGSDLMPLVTGSGCMLSALCGAFAAVEPDALKAAAQAAEFWKRCAAHAEREALGKGPGSFRVALFDAAGSLENRR